MDTSQVLEVMKKNAISISAGVAALLALAVLFFVVNPRYADLDERVRARAALEGEIQSQLTRQRPAITITATGVREGDDLLETFPTAEVIRTGREFMDRVREGASDALAQAVEVNRRVPLLQPDYETAVQNWPLEGDPRQVERDRFQSEYRAVINADNQVQDGRFPGRSIQRAMRGTVPPTQEEMQAARDNLRGRMMRDEPLDNRGNPINAQAFEQRFREAATSLVNEMLFSRASGNLLYVELNRGDRGLTVHPMAAADRERRPTAEDVWDAQVTLWVQQTVAENLVRANREAMANLPESDRSILNAPVKHLWQIRVPQRFVETGAARPQQPFTGPGMPGPGTGDPDERMGPPRGMPGAGTSPGPVRRGVTPGQPTPTPGEPMPDVDAPDDPTAEIERDFEQSPTGRRAHNPFYDVVRFRVSIRCEADQIPYVLQQLQRDALLTVLNVDLRAVDLAEAATQGYVYGNKPVVHLDVMCEMMFLRRWTAPLMPRTVRQTLAELGGVAMPAGDDW